MQQSDVVDASSKPGVSGLEQGDLTRLTAEGNGVPRDQPYPGLITLEIDATDTVRGIVRTRQFVPVAGGGAMTLLYPKWMPGYHSPQNPIELFAGLAIRTEDTLDPVINARAAAMAQLATQRGLLLGGPTALARHRHVDPRTLQ